MIRLGQDLDRTGRIGPPALARAAVALDRCAELVAQFEVARVRFVATSATRDAANATEFADLVQTKLGVVPEVLSGLAEASLSFAGALKFVSAELPSPSLVIDIGGGSTELILGTKTPELACSVDIGAVRLHERHLHSDPPTLGEVNICLADIDAQLDNCDPRLFQARTVVGVAGTILTVAGGAAGVSDYQQLRSGPQTVAVAELLELIDWLLGLTVAQRRALPYMHPGRADVIGAGALILAQVLQRTEVSDLVVSGAGILDGLAWSMMSN